MFQFHKGAIRTVRVNIKASGHIGFNSIKVQLELFLCAIFIAAFVSRFNSIKVQLEPITTRIVTSSFTMGFSDLLVKDLSLKNVDI